MNLRLHIFLFLLFCSIAIPAGAQDVIKLTPEDRFSPEAHALFLEDETGDLTFEEVSSEKLKGDFKTPGPKGLNFGFSGKTYWVKFIVRNSEPDVNDWLLSINYPALDFVDLYIPDRDRRLHIRRTGDLLPFSTREVPDRNFVFRLDLPDEDAREVYLRFSGESSMQFPMELVRPIDYYGNTDVSESVYGIFFGVMLAMILYNLFIYFSFRDNSYIFYVLSVTAFSFYLAAANGQFSRYFAPDWPWLANAAVPVSSGLWIYFSSRFAYLFLDLKRFSPRLTKALNFFGYSGLVLALLSLFIGYGLSVRILASGVLIYCVFLIGTGFRIHSLGNRSARFFILGWSAYLIGVIFYVARNLGLLQDSLFAAHAIEFGSVFEVIFLSFALSDRYTSLRKENEKMQEESLEAQLNLTEELEQKVKFRTTEIRRSRDEIVRQNTELEKVKTELSRQKEILTDKNELLEDRSLKITDSIRYASEIQRAMLTPAEDLNEYFDDFFILNKPKDIVSGDFYWVAKQQNSTILAVADCTGHGVPGAFMSLIGISLLNKIVKESGITEPARILHDLDAEIRRALRQDENDSSLTDGMDAAVLRFDDKKETFIFSGAKSSLYVITDSFFREFKGTRRHLGGFRRERRAEFSSEEFPLGSQNMFYLSSDGYRDQLGMLSRMKLGSTGFKKMILEVAGRPLNEQKDFLEQNINRRIGKKSNQTDDVLVLGFKIKSANPPMNH